MNLAEMARHRALSTEEKCIAYLENMRWPEGVRCPTCGNDSISRFQSKGKSGKIRHLYQCLAKNCRYQFSPTTGTIFHDSHLPLNKWFRAIALVCDAERPMSINQLRLALGVQYKTAAHLAGRIRQAMENGSIELGTGQSGSSATPAAPAVINATSHPSARPGARPLPEAVPMNRPASIAQRRAETADFLKQIVPQSGTQTISGTAVDNVLSMFVSVAQMSVRPPIFFVKYIKDKVFT